MQVKKRKTTHQLKDEELKLSAKWRENSLENDDVRSQSISARDKSAFNWIMKKKCLRDRSTADFELTDELNTHGHFSQNRN